MNVGGHGSRLPADLLNLRAFFRMAQNECDLRVRELRLPHLSSSSRSPHDMREFSKIERCSITEAGDLRIAPSSLHMAFSLGSRLNHSQKSMVAARLVADRKFLVSLSYRVAMRRKGRSGAGVRLMGFMADQFGDGWSFWTLNVLEDFCRSPRSFRA